MTFNVSHFTARHFEWLQQNRHHAGLVVSEQRAVGDTLRRLVCLARERDAETCATASSSSEIGGPSPDFIGAVGGISVR